MYAGLVKLSSNTNLDKFIRNNSSGIPRAQIKTIYAIFSTEVEENSAGS